ncbi:MAG: acyl-CoA dehydrogenase family protein [Myxococcaceae bacterium]
MPSIEPKNPYTFEPYLAWRGKVDFYADDPFVQKIVRQSSGPDAGRVDAAARALSAKASFRWRDLANAIAVPERRPFMVHFDAHNNRVDRIVRPAEVEGLEREVFGEGLFSSRTDLMTRLLKMYLIYQNGESCISCPLVCTEGMVAILEKHADLPQTLAALAHAKEGRDGGFAIGAQFLSEIQGGSDVPANRVEAVLEAGSWRLYGTKFFCSAAHADYAMVTAKPRGAEKVALFLMPSYLPGQEQKARNGYTIDRLKWKMGTSELPTAELSLAGAVAYPVGPLDRGVANVVGVVLTLSRLTVGLSSAGMMTRAAREAAAYASFREAFGQKLADFPMVRAELEQLSQVTRRTTAASFKLCLAFHRATSKQGQFDARELIMLQKFTSAEDCTDVIRKAMSIFGGHGVIEDFSCLPRLYRDSAVNELWEGPRNVLLAQLHRDLQRAASWYPTADFVRQVLAGGDPATIAALAGEISALVQHPSLLTMDAPTIDVCRRWDAGCRALFHAYQDIALREVEAAA